MIHSITTLGLFTPTFEDRQPPKDATVWRISLSPSRAFKLICDIGHLYPTWEQRPRVGGMLEADGAWTLYLWPKVDSDSHLLMLLLEYGAARLADASRWTGDAWVTGDLLAKVLATLATRAYWDMGAGPGLLRDEQVGHLLSLPKQ